MCTEEESCVTGRASVFVSVRTLLKPARWNHKTVKMQRTSYIIGCLVLSASQVSAHPGHGSPATADGIAHYLLSPVHCGPILATTVVLLVASYARKRGVMPKRRSDETLGA